ncbi:MAG TPA: LacI family DNA-binding transcriptional regulator [Microbacterium sp.]|nr:LacI family DNA-binding transcriptional regulator [Microbacterium sp.]
MRSGSAASADASRPSIYDVAERAGVSHMTVSRVLNHHPNIRESTRRRVTDAIAELNYAPSSIARALVRRRSLRIGAIVDNPGQYGPSSTLRAVEAAARENGYAVSALSLEGRTAGIREGILDLVTEGVDALCVIAPRESSLQAVRQHAAALPTLVVKEEADALLHTVSVDQRAGARLAVGHLIELGHRRILHLAGPPDWFDARARTAAWRDALEDAGLDAPDPVVGDWSSESGYLVGRALRLDGATAVFAANDQMALGLLHALAERGIRVPDDVSVVGFDDVPDARHYTPPLTTVRQDFTALGRLVIRELLTAIDGGQPGHRELIRPELVVRASTSAVLR